MIKVNYNYKYYKRKYLNVPQEVIRQFVVKFFGNNPSIVDFNEGDRVLYIQYDQDHHKNMLHEYHYYDNTRKSGAGGANYLLKKHINWLNKELNKKKK